MKSTITKSAAVAATAALAFSGAIGVSNAQDTGSLPTESLAGGSGELSSGSEGSGDSAGNGSAGQDFGSLILDGNATGEGSLDTSGSASLEEPTTGSLSDSVSGVIDLTDTNSLTPGEGNGSVDTSGSASLEEPTTGSLAPIYAPVAGSLGIGGGATTVLGSEGGTGSLVPIILVGGSAATIAAGIHFAPQIHQGLTDMGIQLPPLPGAAPAPQAQPAPAPGPGVPNGRG